MSKLYHTIGFTGLTHYRYPGALQYAQVKTCAGTLNSNDRFIPYDEVASCSVCVQYVLTSCQRMMPTYNHPEYLRAYEVLTRGSEL